MWPSCRDKYGPPPSQFPSPLPSRVWLRKLQRGLKAERERGGGDRELTSAVVWMASIIKQVLSLPSRGLSTKNQSLSPLPLHLPLFFFTICLPLIRRLEGSVGEEAHSIAGRKDVCLQEGREEERNIIQVRTLLSCYWCVLCTSTTYLSTVHTYMRPTIICLHKETFRRAKLQHCKTDVAVAAYFLVSTVKVGKGKKILL